MTPQLEQLDGQFQTVSERAGDLAEMAGAKLAVRPAPGRWSVAECLEHLRVSSEAFFPVLSKAFEEARKRNQTSDGPYRLDFMGKLLIWTLEPPPKFRFPTPPAFLPVEMGPPGRVLRDFLTSQQRVREVLAAGDGLALDKIKIRSPFDRRVRYSAWSALCAAASHQRRHLWQAEQALRLIA